jgi:GT2 family glycosyltransferase/nucleoside phosphorylase
MKIELIIICALKQELPIMWLADLGYPVFTIKALQAGILHKQPINKSILFIISGVGQEAAKNTAQWLQTNLQPKYVLNIGTVGACTSKYKRHTFIIPQKLAFGTQPQINHEPILPIPVPSEKIKTVPLLQTVTTPIIKNKTSENMAVDMESYHFAKAFKKATFSFHVLKIISDYACHKCLSDFQNSLVVVRQKVKVLLSFLEPIQKPQIDVIIPFYNRQPFKNGCLSSVLEQTYPAHNIFLINDGSDINTFFKNKADFPDNVKLIKLKRNHGVSYARNKGLSKSKAPWVAFLDSDDLWHKNKLQKQVDFIQKHPYYEILQTDEKWIKDGQRINQCQHHQKPSGWIWSKCLALCLISPSAVLLKRHLFKTHGLFDEALAVCEDYDLWLRLTREKIVGLVPDPLVIKHGGHPDQLSKKYPAMDRFRLKALEKAYAKEKNPLYQAQLLDIINKKQNILIHGASKRNKMASWANIEKPGDRRE